MRHTAAWTTFVAQGELSCVSGTASGTGRLDWTDSGTTASEFSFAVVVGARPGGISVIVLTGTITSGDFAGQTLLAEVVIIPGPVAPLNCLTEQGLETASGPVSITIA